MSINVKVFKSKLAGVKRSLKNVSETVQELIVMAGDHYIDTTSQANTAYFGMITETLVSSGGADARKLVAYIESHYNVKYTTIINTKGTKQNVFKKDKNDANALQLKPLDVAWNVWARDKFAPKPFDPTNAIIRLIATAQRKLEKGEVTSKTKTRNLLAVLQDAELEFEKKAS